MSINDITFVKKLKIRTLLQNKISRKLRWGLLNHLTSMLTFFFFINMRAKTPKRNTHSSLIKLYWERDTHSSFDNLIFWTPFSDQLDQNFKFC
jgi:hypothetical protein